MVIIINNNNKEDGAGVVNTYRVVPTGHTFLYVGRVTGGVGTLATVGLNAVSCFIHVCLSQITRVSQVGH